MKTDYEWQETLDGTVGGVQEREVIRAIQRDAFQAGAGAINHTEIAREIVDWVADQKYGEQNILHAAVCCDHVGRTRFLKSIADLIKQYPLPPFPEATP
jgi:hypothetical protein